MIVNQSNLRDLFIGFEAAFQQGFRDAPIDWDMVATVVPSGTAENHYAWLGQWPMLREWVGDRVITQMAAHDYRIKNKKFEGTVEVKREDIADDIHGVYGPMMVEMGYAAKQHPNQIIFPMFPAGLTTPCYDGQSFFSTSHPVGREGAITPVSNDQGGNGTNWYLLDCSRPLRPFIFQKREEYRFRNNIDLNDSRVFLSDKFLFGVDCRVAGGYGFWQQAYHSAQPLTQANFEAAYAAMQQVQSDEGRPLGIKATHIVVPSSLRAAAKTLVREKDSYGGDNIDANLVKVLDTPWLS